MRDLLASAALAVLPEVYRAAAQTGNGTAEDIAEETLDIAQALVAELDKRSLDRPKAATPATREERRL